MQCKQCDKPLSVYDVGFYRRLVNRGAQSCLCIPCTAAYFCISEERAWELIRRYQQAGCTLFPPPKEEEPCMISSSSAQAPQV